MLGQNFKATLGEFSVITYFYSKRYLKKSIIEILGTGKIAFSILIKLIMVFKLSKHHGFSFNSTRLFEI